MKKFITLISLTILVIIISNPINARSDKAIDFDYFPRHEIYLQYGTPTILELTTMTGKTMITEKDGINIEGKTSNYVFSGALAAGYSFMINDRISLGIDFNYSYASADIKIKDLPMPFTFTSEVMSYTGMLSGHLTYYQEGALEISSGLYLGLNYKDEILSKSALNFYNESDKCKFAYHLTALKVRYGETVGLLAELGFGFRGLVNIGLSIKL